MKIKSYANQKGGSGKSILSYNDAFFLAEKGFRVLFIDGDEQGNSSAPLQAYALSGIVASDLFKDQPLPVGEPVPGQKLSVIMADDGLISAERTSMDDAEMVQVVSKNIAHVGQHFDYVVIDTAGSNSRIANAFLVSSDFVALPCRIDTYSIDVAKKVLQRVLFIQQKWNPKLVNLGILPNEFDATHPAQVEWLKQLMTHFRAYVFPGYIPKRGAYKEAAAEGIPVWRLASDAEGDSAGRVKTAARTAGKEAKAVFEKMLERMENGNG